VSQADAVVMAVFRICRQYAAKKLVGIDNHTDD